MPGLKIKLICENCGIEFERLTGEVNRNKKLGRKTVCSLKCSGKINIKNIPEEKRGNINRIPIEKRKRKLDKFSPFKRMFTSASTRARNNKKMFSINIEDVYEIWNLQNGLCPYTGEQMILPKSTSDVLAINPYQASIDRIDSNKGYEKNNIEIVSLIAQYAKNIFSKEQVIEFCEKVVKNRFRKDEINGRHF
jgi:hypothetical protein